LTRVVISQPMYFPWSGFLAQMALADIYIWLDDAQFSKGSFTNRVQVKLPGGSKWMSVPLVNKGTHCAIQDLEAKGSDWQASHRALLKQSLRDRPHSVKAMHLFDEAIAKEGTLCCSLIASAEVLAKTSGVLPPQILRASNMGITGSSWQRVLNIVTAVGGKTYITGHGARNYLDHEAFDSAGIDVRYMNYKIFPWPQPYGNFTPYVSGLDLIASTDPETALLSHLRLGSTNWRAFLTDGDQSK
jgi:hypothetical protein